MPKNYLLKLKGWVGGWSFDPIVVDCVLSGNPDKANVLIDSPGGDLNAGLSIRAAMMEHGNVHVQQSPPWVPSTYPWTPAHAC